MPAAARGLGTSFARGSLHLYPKLNFVSPTGCQTDGCHPGVLRRRSRAMAEADASLDERTIPEGWIEVGRYASLREAEDHGLVVLAMGLDYWIQAEPNAFHLLVPAAAGAAVLEQLELFDRESVNWPPQPVPAELARFRGRQLTPLIWVAVTLAVFAAQQEWPGRLEAWGAVDPTAMFAGGEWWRAATALFLHGGAAHLTTNLAAGYFVLAAVLNYFSRWRGWLLLAAAGVGGNLLAVALRHADVYRSLGASTAIFGGLGLLTGRALLTVPDEGRPRWRLMIRPLAAGVALLGLFGAGGVTTDVLAHVTGFGVGLGCGSVFHRR